MPSTVRARGTRPIGSDSDAPKGKPRNDVYVGLLLIALLAQVAGCILLYLDFSSYPEGTKPNQVPMAPLKIGPPGQPPPAGRRGNRG